MEWDQREWEKGEELCQEGSRNSGEAFSSILDTMATGRIEQLPLIVDKSSPQEVQESRAVQELLDWGNDGAEQVLIGAMVLVEGIESSIAEIPPVNMLTRPQVTGIGVSQPDRLRWR